MQHLDEATVSAEALYPTSIEIYDKMRVLEDAVEWLYDILHQADLHQRQKNLKETFDELEENITSGYAVLAKLINNHAIPA